jgi:pyruvate,orthophosphate dikinase
MTKKTKKQVYYFGDGKAEGSQKLKSLLGGKGANLAEMNLLKIPVPAGFTITTEVCNSYYKNNKKFSPTLKKEVLNHLKKIEKSMGFDFGSTSKPILLSVRSGAKVSMPGMMDTILNLGLNDQTVIGLAKLSGSERFAYDSYRRFIQMYGDVVLDVDHHHFEKELDQLKKKRKIKLDTDLNTEDLKSLVQTYKKIIKQKTKKDFPENVQTQLWGAIQAVFDSWMNKRAIEYRRINSIDDSIGTAVNIQSMVFGNMGEDSATGVAFTRDPSTGEKVFFGEFLINAQGEDVVAGIRTPNPINKSKTSKGESLEEKIPSCYRELVKIYKKLEKHYKDMQDIEFTIQKGKLWMLQTRNGKRSAMAAVKIAVDMVGEKLISKKEAIQRIDPLSLDQLLHPRLDPKASREIIAKGLPASPGASTGLAVFSDEEALEYSEKGKKVILVRIETSPEDIQGMNLSEGILTSRGGMTSHAAVVARGMGKPCVSGCEEIHINEKKGEFISRGVKIKRGEELTIDGSTGLVMKGVVPTMPPQLSKEFHVFMKWVDATRKLKVRTNADTPTDAKVARNFGAEGIGLCRTEHMFFEENRIDLVREMILAESTEDRKKPLDKILPLQKKDFKGIFKAMKGYPVTIRLLDPPLHEFIPQSLNGMKELSKKINVPLKKLLRKKEQLDEFNPMLGHRGCRLGITYPEIYQMQAKAIILAASELIKKEKFKIIPEIMIPLVVTDRELKLLKDQIIEVIEETIKNQKVKMNYQIGTMIELPRACFRAGKIAKLADFFSFGTNDLTQTVYGISRDDANKFLPYYLDQSLFDHDPFAVLDQNGVGELVKLAANHGKNANRKLKLGICGEHGGEPSSAKFFHENGFDYVSCSPYRVPIARLALAQAVLKN